MQSKNKEYSAQKNIDEYVRKNRGVKIDGVIQIADYIGASKRKRKGENYGLFKRFTRKK